MTTMDQLSSRAMQAFASEAKLGLLATVNADGLPHLTLITTLEAKAPRQLMWGQFTEGQSKVHVRDNPRVGFLVMSPDRYFWRGTARWTDTRRDGEDYEHYNHQAMFRYNAYFGIHTIHYMDLLGVEPRRRLSVPGIAAGGLALAAARPLLRGGRQILNPYTRELCSRMAALRFLTYVAHDGHPRILPVVPGVAGADHLLFARSVLRGELGAIPAGTPLACLCMTQQMESVLVRGRLRHRALGCSRLDVDWVYNSMPPLQGQIYPPLPLKAVRFESQC